MQIRCHRISIASAALSVLLTGVMFLPQRVAAQEKPLLAEQVFKNIRVLRGLPLDDFMGTMGVMVAALESDCADCHVGAGTDAVDWAADTPKKIRARAMVTMMANLNKNYFGGRQMVTCWTCHRNRGTPLVTPNMAVMYGAANTEPDDVVTQIPGLPSAESILDKFIQASGGAQRLAGLTSFVARGTSVGFGGFGADGAVEMLAKAPDKLATNIVFKAETGRGDQVRTYNGTTGWMRTPLNVLGEFQLSGTDLDGARVDAMLAFPGQIKQVATNWKSAPPTTITDLPAPSAQTSVQQEASAQEHDVDVVQGTGPRGLLVTLYFDRRTNLLLRELRMGNSPIGRIPTQIDYSDYRDVNGIKLPFRRTFAWLDGRDSIVLNDIRINVPVDDAKFGKPAPLKK